MWRGAWRGIGARWDLLVIHFPQKFRTILRFFGKVAERN
jgi:hypothetical protein